MRRTFSFGFLLAATVVLSVSSAAAQTVLEKMDAVLANEVSSTAIRRATERASLIVQTDGALTSSEARQFRRLGGKIKGRFSVIEGFSGSLPQTSLDELAALPWVKRVSSDMTVKKLDDTALPAVGTDVAQFSYQLDGNAVVTLEGEGLR